MAVQVQDRVIGDTTYRVRQLTALKARALFVRLVKAVGPALASLVGSGRTGALLSVDFADLAPMLTEFLDRLSDDELGYFCDTLGSATELVGDSGATATLNRQLIDTHFAGQLLNLFRWLAFGLEVQFSDFLGELKRIQVAKSPAPPASAQSPSPGLSTGTSGAS